MKNVSKLALFVAAGMASASVHAATIDIREDTTLSIAGEFNAFYLDLDAVDTSLDSADSGTNAEEAENNENDVDGALEFEVSAVRSFTDFDAYVSAIFEFTTLEAGGSGLGSDEAVAGLKGDFGQIEVGHTDSVYEDLIHDAVDPFEEATLVDSDIGLDEDTMITYYTPDMSGFSLNLQLGIEDEAQKDVSNTEGSLIASAAYDFGAGALHVGYDDLGTNADSSDQIIGVAAVFNVGDAAEVAINHEMQTVSDADTDFTGVALSVDYGPGDIYGAYKGVSSAANEDQSQYALGLDYEIESDFKLWFELANFDGQSATDADSLVGIGTEYKF